MLSVKYLKLTDLEPYPSNARTHSDEQIAQIMASIQEFGFTNPLLIDENKGIIAGHGRAAAAQRLDMDKVPTLTLEGLSEAQRRAYAIADNKLALNAGWDIELLTQEVSELLNMDFDVGLMGFSADEIQGLLRTEHEDEDDILEVTESITKSGDTWILGGHRLVCGDSTDAFHVEQVLNGVKPHLMVTDPPYGVEYDATWRGKAGHATLGKNRVGKVSNDSQMDWRDAWALFPGAIVYVWHGGLHSHSVAESLESCGFEMRSQIIWNKTVMAMSRGDYHWKHEPCWYAVKGGGDWHGDRKQTTVWDIASPIHIMAGSKENKTDHPTQKPVECMRRPIINNSSVGQVVYDPFLGSGTTIIAAETEGRYCYGLEIDPGYCDIIVKRWEEFTGNKAELQKEQAA